MPIVHQHCHIVRMVPYSFEEYSSSKQTDLQRGYVDVGAVLVPCPCSDRIGDDGREEAIEVEQEEQGKDTADEDLYQVNPVETAAIS